MTPQAVGFSQFNLKETHFLNTFKQAWATLSPNSSADSVVGIVIKSLPVFIAYFGKAYFARFSRVSHYWGRGRENTRFDEDNCISLCSLPCHQSWGHGDGREEYTEFMKKRLGKKGFEDLMLRAHIYKKKDDQMDELYIRELLGGE